MVLSRSTPFLDGQVAVVTGGGAGIGRGIAEALAAFGARVAVWDRDEETCTSTAAAVGGLGQVLDVRNASDVDLALARAVTELGPVDILVNNAGGSFSAPFLETSDNGFDALLQENLGQVLRCSRRVAAAMVADGRRGSIINVTSIEASRAAPGFAAYAAAKAGVANFTQTAAVELAPHGIRVNAIAPDVCITEGLLRLAEASGGSGEPGSFVPLGRGAHIDEVAAVAVFLACPMSSYVTGTTIHVDGGSSAAGGWSRASDGGFKLGLS